MWRSPRRIYCLKRTLWLLWYDMDSGFVMYGVFYCRIIVSNRIISGLIEVLKFLKQKPKT